MKKGEHKARNLAWQAAARALLVEREIDLRGQIPLQELSHVLKARVGCSYDTAKRHLHRAGMLMRGELSKAPQWGGAHGGHEPPKERPAPKTATIKAGSPITAALTHGAAYTHLGTGKATIERVGAERVVRVELGEGSVLVLTVF